MLMSSFYDGIPRELEEAARVDGAGRFGTLFRVVVPLVKPGMLAVGIYAFLLSWDDYLHASTLIQTDSLRHYPQAWRFAIWANFPMTGR